MGANQPSRFSYNNKSVSGLRSRSAISPHCGMSPRHYCVLLSSETVPYSFEKQDFQDFQDSDESSEISNRIQSDSNFRSIEKLRSASKLRSECSSLIIAAYNYINTGNCDFNKLIPQLYQFSLANIFIVAFFVGKLGHSYPDRKIFLPFQASEKSEKNSRKLLNEVFSMLYN
ncbi:hypothetical protein WN51_14265 [Melipona quadrifasciata]|uniref:Uncharacterized protein n=1 Tax=Melipona quadrifasciata TaxID=166423 RepID=A0A0M9A3H4_9HYME|nr:hypothetical protein WN51_14265 [Melipona quadrifasciata]